MRIKSITYLLLLSILLSSCVTPYVNMHIASKQIPGQKESTVRLVAVAAENTTLHDQAKVTLYRLAEQEHTDNLQQVVTVELSLNGVEQKINGLAPGKYKLVCESLTIQQKQLQPDVNAYIELKPGSSVTVAFGVALDNHSIQKLAVLTGKAVLYLVIFVTGVGIFILL